jgi:carbamoyl-phosphate synthase large subunit
MAVSSVEHLRRKDGQRVRVLVAGAAGASLGTEAVKSLVLDGRFDVCVADIHPLAFGLYMPGPLAQALLRVDHYLPDLLEFCRTHRVRVVVPGAEATLSLISSSADRLAEAGVMAAVNAPAVVATCSNKSRTFDRLASLGVAVPRTWTLCSPADVQGVEFPCVVKPATGSGGSAMVAVAAHRDEALMWAQLIWASGRHAVAQEYLPADDGEFTVGVLTLGGWTGSIAMRREFPSKLSYLVRDSRFTISSGYSQGLIDDFPEVRRDAERIACLLGSSGPLNIQGRVRDGRFIPFEINPRFSATTYLRHLAGFPELGMHIDFLLSGAVPTVSPRITPGFYLRSLAECHVPTDRVVVRP